MANHTHEEAHVAGTAHDAHHAHHDEGWFKKYFWSTDHKIIGFQYMFTGMALALLGAFMAYVFRMQLAFPGQSVPGFGVVSPGQYNMLITNHGSIMIFWVAMPVLIAGFGNYLIPLMVGADDMVFPRLNRLSYQLFLLSAIVLLASLAVQNGGFGGAWTAYPPLSANANYSLTKWGSSLWLIAVTMKLIPPTRNAANSTATAITHSEEPPGVRLYSPLAESGG